MAAFDYDEKKQKEDLEHIELIGDGLLDKMPLSQATHKLIMQDNLWMFDNNELPEFADRLRKAGELVIGTSGLSAKMERDRDYAAGVAESVGLELPETKKFTDYDSALKFLESSKDKSYVYKPFEGDATSTYVPQERDDLPKANQELREYITSLKDSGDEASPKFILQEVVEGVEAAFELWLRDGKPIVAFCDLESKRKMTGDLGENIGCAGGYVIKVPIGSKGVQETAAKYLKWKEIKSYTGSVDVNVLIVNGKPQFLENCFRFGYAAYPAMFHCLAHKSVEETLREWITGTGLMGSWFSSDVCGSLTLTSDNAKDGSPLLIPKGREDEVDLYRAYKEGKRLAIVEGWPEICCCTASARTIESTGAKCLSLAKEVSFPDKGYRIDLATDQLPTLPLSRFRALQTAGYFK